MKEYVIVILILFVLAGLYIYLMGNKVLKMDVSENVQTYFSKKYTLTSLNNVKSIIGIDSLRFNSTRKEWNIVKSKGEAIFPKNNITFVTYNVWFDSFNFDNRAKSMIKIFEEKNPDFICLQEVTYRFIGYLMNSPFIRKHYYMSNNFKGGYDVLLLSKYDSKFYLSDFVSRMGRKLILTEVFIKNEDSSFNSLYVATSHLESMNSQTYRKNQLSQTFDILNTSPFAFFMGDFNFDSNWKDEEVNVDRNFHDSWNDWKNRFKLKDEEGITWPKDPNDDEYPASKFDRVLFKSYQNRVKLNHFELLGTDKIVIDSSTGKSYVKFPSDHFGIYTGFDISS